MRSYFYSVVAPKRRAAIMPPALGLNRALLRWRVVREARPVMVGLIAASGYEHVSSHWTRRSARKAAQRLQAVHGWR